MAFIDPSGHLPEGVIGAIIGAIMGSLGGGYLAYEESIDNQGGEDKADKLIAFRDGAIGFHLGGLIGGAAGFASGGTALAFGTKTLANTMVGGVFSALNAGMTYRVTNEIATSTTANILDENNVKTFVYTETKTAEEIFNDALEVGVDPQAMLLDGTAGGAVGIMSYGFSQALKFNKLKHCGDISNKAKQTVIDDVLDKTDDVANMVDDATNTPYGYYQDTNGRWHRPNGQFASNEEVGIIPQYKTPTSSHGNSLKDSRTNYGYSLVDKSTGEILKFGETIHPATRYSQKFLKSNNARMMVLERGNKLDIHLWQHDMNEYYFYKYNEYPPLNNGGW